MLTNIDIHNMGFERIFDTTIFPSTLVFEILLNL